MTRKKVHEERVKTEPELSPPKPEPPVTDNSATVVPKQQKDKTPKKTPAKNKPTSQKSRSRIAANFGQPSGT